ncbi:nucleotidyltransferase domain-containing protein [Bacillus weihaiensis]|uniref:Nucleotidyltransferase n=1 Tax=Bacillus weihaiensis TaxID=1547283 RepID=A0A1L3MTK0_9BACI|nr:nucleotidyltransferase domain-containing protein [Bacillus weihaiensis]APH05656.1 hypothetical protein A9C19_13350 [Bacillus weihaiensis]
MKGHIIKVLKQIEIDYEVKVLYACESGSRAWGFPSEKSDYDVRFIYVHKKEWYLSIDQKRDVLEIPVNDSLSIQVDPLLDLSGWELTKALRLFRKSNPGLLEWLYSSNVYYQAFSTIEHMKSIESNVFASHACYYHYLHMAKGNLKDLVRDEQLSIKKYLTTLRPILAATWIVEKQTFPPIEFIKLVEEFISEFKIKEEILSILHYKKAGVMKVDFFPSTLAYLQEQIVYLENASENLTVQDYDPTAELNQIFRDTLLEVW